MLISMEDCVRTNIRMGGIPFKGVLHIGAHKGEEAEAYTGAGVQQVLWIEGNQSLMKDLYDATKKFRMEQQYLCEILSDKDGEKVKFYITNNSQSSSILPLGLHRFYHPLVRVVEIREVETIRFDSLYKKHAAMVPLEEYDFVNLDVQGAELKVLQGFGDLLQKYPFKAIYTEVNERYLYKNCCLVGELDEYLKQFGFQRITTRMTVFKWGDAMYVRKLYNC